MKKIALVLLSFLLTTGVFAESLDPVDQLVQDITSELESEHSGFYSVTSDFNDIVITLWDESSDKELKEIAVSKYKKAKVLNKHVRVDLLNPNDLNRITDQYYDGVKTIEDGAFFNGKEASSDEEEEAGKQETPVNEGTPAENEAAEKPEEEALDPAACYELGIKAESKGYYKLAETFYKEAGDYEDAQQKYEVMMNLLKQFDGMYKSTSDAGIEGKSAVLQVKDGIVIPYFENDEGETHSKYELHHYEFENGDVTKDIVAFSKPITEEFKSDSDAEYSEGFTFRNIDGKYVVEATKDSTDQSFNGEYEKVHDAAMDSFFEETEGV